MDFDAYNEYIEDWEDQDVTIFSYPEEQYFEYLSETYPDTEEIDIEHEIRKEELLEKQVSNVKKKYLARNDPFKLDRDEFFITYRFSKKSVKNLVKVLFPTKRKNNRGLPFDPEQVVCTALKHLAGASLDELNTKDGISKATALRHFYAFIRALNKQKKKYIAMPDIETMNRNIKTVWEKYHLCNIIGTNGVTEIELTSKPRNLPEGETSEEYKDKDGNYGINVELVTGIDNLVYAARIFPPSEIKEGRCDESMEITSSISYLSSLNTPVYILGEPTQSLTETVITPFSRWETSHDESKALFNLRHSMARSEMTHRTVQLWKKRFPRLLNPTYKLEIIKEMISACLVLHNISILWDEPLPDYMLQVQPLTEAVHTVHEDVEDHTASDTSLVVRQNMANKCLNSPLTNDEKQVLELTMPVQIILQNENQISVFPHQCLPLSIMYPTVVTQEVTLQTIGNC